jgi:importin subunit beta-1
MQSTIRKLRGEITPFADRIMTNLLAMFAQSSKMATTMEDGFLAVGALTTG